MSKKFTKLMAALALLVFMTPSLAGWGQTTVASFSRSSTTDTYTEGQTFTYVAESKTGFYQDGSGTAGTTQKYLQLKGSTAYWTTTPESISFTAKLGGGSTKDPLVYNVLVALLDNDGNEISGTSTTVTTKITNNTGSDFTVSIPAVNNVYGVKLSHIKESSYNVRYYSFSLSYVAGSSSSVATPQFSKGTSYCDEEQSITITCDTEGATIYYTLDGSEPTSSSTPYSGAISITETKTLRAIAVKDEESSAEASATYTFVTTLKTMEAIYAAATAAGSTATTVYIHFNNFVISAINSGSPSTVAYLTDGTHGCYIFSSGHGFAAGNVLNGIASCSLKKNYTMSYITGLTASSPDLVITDGGTVSPVVTTIDALSGINTGSVVTIKDLTWNSSETTLSDGTYTIKLSNAISNQSSLLTNGNKYDITGVFDYNSSSEKRINPRNANDIVPVITPATLPFNWAGGGKDALMALQGVTANGLGSDYAASNAPYLVKFDTNGDYILVRTDSQPDVVTIGVKKFGSGGTEIKVQGSVDGETFTDVETLTFNVSQNNTQTLSTQNSFGANVRYVRIIRNSGANVGVGPISISKYVEKYAVILANVSNGTISADKATAAEGETVTLTATPNTHYGFTAWSVYKTGDPETTITVTENQFTMPAYAVTVSATFTALTIRDINIPLAIEDNVIVDATDNQAYAGDEVTISVDAPVDQSLTSLTVTGNISGDEISISPAVSPEQDEYTFTMPDEDVTISATFGGEYTVTYSVNGNIVTIDPVVVTIGESITLPTSVTPPTGFEFAGWTANANNTSDIHTGSYTPMSDITLYAVYSKTVVGPTVSREVILDGEATGLDSTILDTETTISEDDFSYKAIGIKNYNVQSGATNAFETSHKTIIGGKDNDVCIYNSTAFGDGITKFEIYSNYGASTSVVVGVNFGINQITSYNSEASDTWSQTLGTANHVYDASSALPAGAKYFCFGISKDKNAQVQFRITYTETPVTASYYTRVFQNETATAAIDIVGPSIIPSGSTMNMSTYALSNNNASNLIIEEGGQLIHNNAGVQATVQKNIAAHGATPADGGWYFISSPIWSSSSYDYGITPSAAGLITDNYGSSIPEGATATYDLFKFDQSVDLEWRNYRNANFNLDRSEGYLYANMNDVTLSFEGEIRSSDGNATTVLDNISVASLAGWNLMGNPFTCKAYSSLPYYVIDGAQLNTTAVVASTPIDVCTGIMVHGSNSMTFSRTQQVNAPNGNLQMTVAQQVISRDGTSTGSTTIDNAIVSFNESDMLEKFVFNADLSKLYIPQDGKDYAIVASEGQGTLPVNFKATENGNYTLTVNPEGVDLNYLHLIDNMTGNDVDLLQTPSYTFEASTRDYESRFRLVFASASTDSATDESFAYFNGSEWVIDNNGEATLQVVDVLGRIISTETINGNFNLNLNQKAGVYMLRLINGENVKVQKVVVR